MAHPANRGADKRLLDFLALHPGSDLHTIRDALCYRGPALAPSAVNMGLSSLRHKGFLRSTAEGYFLTAEGEKKKAEFAERSRPRTSTPTAKAIETATIA